MFPGVSNKAFSKTKLALVTTYRMLVKIRSRQVPMDGPEMPHSLALEAEAGRARSRRFVRLVQGSLHRRPAPTAPGRTLVSELAGPKKPPHSGRKRSDLPETPGR